MKSPLTSRIAHRRPQFATLLRASIWLPVVFLTACGPKEVAPSGGTSAGSSSKTETGSPAQTTTKAEASEVPLKGPATVAEAAKILDLKNFTLIEGASEDHRAERTLANLNYAVRSDVKTAFEAHRKKLTADKWKEQPNTYISEQSASGTFSRNGFLISVSIYPDAKSGLVSVALHQHGNVNLSKLPRPADAKPMYEGPASAMYTTDSSVADTVENCRKLLLAAGWEPHGGAGDVLYYKQNAVRISVSVSVGAAKGDKTFISFGSELMSADLPAPPDAIDVRYVDSQRKLTFDTTAEKEAVAEYYNGALAKTGYKPNEEKLINNVEKSIMVFRDADGGIILLDIYKEREGKRGVSLEYTTMKEIDDAGMRIKEKIARDKEKKKADEEMAAANRPKISVTLPGDATGVEMTKASLKFTIGNGKAKAWAESWKKSLLSDGWKAGAGALEGMAGMISLSKDDQNMSLSYTDTGFTPAEISITAIGVDLVK